jgi:hypothetical protein
MYVNYFALNLRQCCLVDKGLAAKQALFQAFKFICFTQEELHARRKKNKYRKGSCSVCMTTKKIIRWRCSYMMCTLVNKYDFDFDFDSAFASAVTSVDGQPADDMQI